MLWVRSFSTRLPSVIFAEEKVLLISLFSVKNAIIVQLLSLTLNLTQFPEQIDQINWSVILSNGTLFSKNLVQ